MKKFLTLIFALFFIANCFAQSNSNISFEGNSILTVSKEGIQEIGIKTSAVFFPNLKKKLSLGGEVGLSTSHTFPRGGITVDEIISTENGETESIVIASQTSSLVLGVVAQKSNQNSFIEAAASVNWNFMNNGSGPNGNISNLYNTVTPQVGVTGGIKIAGKGIQLMPTIGINWYIPASTYLKNGLVAEAGVRLRLSPEEGRRVFNH